MIKINVLGYGIMGQQIASLFYLGGFDVHIWNHTTVDKKAISRQIKLLKRTLGKPLGNEGQIAIHTDLNELDDAITIESIKEDLEVKKSVYKQLKHFKNPFFSNSSSFSSNEIGGEVNVLHFYNPISLKLLEVNFVNDDIEKIMSPIMKYFEVLDFTIVNVNLNRGYIGNYILFNEISSALKLIEKYNYNYLQIIPIYKTLYNGRDILQIIDLVGIDIVFNILTNLQEKDSTIYVPNCLKVALNKNILGKKNKTSIKDVLKLIPK